MPDIEKTDCIKEILCPKWTNYNDRRICVYLQTDTDKLNNVVYPYQNKSYLTYEIDLKPTAYQLLLAKWVYLLTYIDIF